MATAPTTPARRPAVINLPNGLTLARLVLAGVLFACIAEERWLTGLVVFAVAAFTDWLDGYLARRQGLTSAFGRNFDPLVDKVLICGAFIFLLPWPPALLQPWMVTVVVARELIITGLRSFMETQRTANFGADWLGKIKMTLQCAALLAILGVLGLGESAGSWAVVQLGLIWAMLAATALSGLQYLWRALVLLREAWDWTVMDDHDQRFKGLLHDFLGEFVQLFFPEWAARLNFTRPEFLDQETFFDPPSGERGLLDVVAQVAVRQPIAEPRTGADRWLLLIHVEIESADSVTAFRPRMCEYYRGLRRKHPLPVLPIALYLRVGLEGIGWDVYEERLWDRPLLRFEYPYVGLPALDGLTYLHGSNLLGVALAALMRLPAERRAELKLEAALQIARSGESSERAYKLTECLDAYFPLNDEQRTAYEHLKQSDQGREVREMAVGWIEQGREQERREALRKLLTKKFGLLSEKVRARLLKLSMEQMEEMLFALLDASSLQELGLGDE